MSSTAGAWEHIRSWVGAALVVVLTWLAHGSVAPHRGGHNFGPWPDSYEYAAGAQAIAETGRYYLQVGDLEVQPRYPPGTSALHGALFAAGLPPTSAYRVNAALAAALAVLLFVATRRIVGRMGLEESKAGRWLADGAALGAGLGFGTSGLVLERTFVDSDLLAALLATVALFLVVTAVGRAHSRRATWCLLAAGVAWGSVAAVRPVTALLLAPCLAALWVGLWAGAGPRRALGAVLPLAVGGAVPVLATCWLMWRSGWGALAWTGYQLWVPQVYGETGRSFQLAFATAGNPDWPVPRWLGSGLAGHGEIAAAVYLGLPLVERHGLGWFWQLAAVVGAVWCAAEVWKTDAGQRSRIGWLGAGLALWFGGHTLLYSLYFYPDDRFHLAPAALLFPGLFASGAALIHRRPQMAWVAVLPALALLWGSSWRAYADLKSQAVHGIDPSIAEVHREFGSWRERPLELRRIAPIPFDTVAAQALGLLTAELATELGALGQPTYSHRHAAHALASGWIPDRDVSLPVPPGRPAAHAPLGAKLTEAGGSKVLWPQRTARFALGPEGSTAVEVDLKHLVETGVLRVFTGAAGNNRAGEPLFVARWMHRPEDGAEPRPLPLAAAALREFPGGLEVHLVRESPHVDLVLRMRVAGASVSFELGGEAAGLGPSWVWDVRFLGSSALPVARGPTQGVLAPTPAGWVSLLEDLGRSSARDHRSIAGALPRSPHFRSAAGVSDSGRVPVQAHLWWTAHEERAMCLPPPATTPSTALALAARVPLILTADPLPRLSALEGHVPWVVFAISGEGAPDPLQAERLALVDGTPLAELAAWNSRLATSAAARFAVLAGSLDSALLRASAERADALWIAPGPTRSGARDLPDDRPPRILVGAQLDADGGLLLGPGDLAGILRGDILAVLVDGGAEESALERGVLEVASFVTPLVARLAHARAHGEEYSDLPTSAGEPMRFRDGLELFVNLSEVSSAMDVEGVAYTLEPGGYVARDGDGFFAARVAGDLGTQWFAEVPGRFRARRHHPDELPVFRSAQGPWSPSPLGAPTCLERVDAVARTRIFLSQGGLWSEPLPAGESPAVLRILKWGAPGLTWREPRTWLELQALAAEGRVIAPPADASWRSSDEAVLTVDTEGFVRGLASGRARVTAHSPSTGLAAEVMLDVDLVGPPRGLVASWSGGRLRATFEAPGALEASLLVESLAQRSVIPAERADAHGRFRVDVALPPAQPGYALRPLVRALDGTPVLGETVYVLTDGSLPTEVRRSEPRGASGSAAN